MTSKKNILSFFKKPVICSKASVGSEQRGQVEISEHLEEPAIENASPSYSASSKAIHPFFRKNILPAQSAIQQKHPTEVQFVCSDSEGSDTTDEPDPSKILEIDQSVIIHKTTPSSENNETDSTNDTSDKGTLLLAQDPLSPQQVTTGDTTSSHMLKATLDVSPNSHISLEKDDTTDEEQVGIADFECTLDENTQARTEVKRKKSSASETSVKSSKKIKRMCSYNTEWQAKYTFIKKSTLGSEYAYCTFCNKDISITHGGVNDINVHCKSQTHQQRSAQQECMISSRKITSWASSSETKSLDDQANRAALLWTAFLIEHNISFLASDHAAKLFKEMFPGDVTKRFACGRTKTTHLCNGVIAPEAQKSVANALLNTNEGWFSIATDGSSDTEDKLFPVLVTHHEKDSVSVVTSMLDMFPCNKATGENIFNGLSEALTLKGLDWKNCVAYSSDNASVMIGRHNSVLSRVKAKQPSVFDVGCPCHLAHIVSQRAAKVLSVNVEELIIDTYYHFEKACGRKQDLRDFMVFCSTDVRKVLKHCSTRWLSQMKCVERILSKWDALEGYFFTYFKDGEDENGQGSKKGSEREKRLVSKFENKITMIYLCFVHAVLNGVDSFNVLLQSKEPKIHVLHEEIIKLYKHFLVKLIRVEIVANKSESALLNIDYSDEANQKDDRDLFIGFSGRQALRAHEEDLNITTIKRFFSDVRAFYCAALKYMHTKFPLNNKVLKAARYLDPKNRSAVGFYEIADMLEKFPGIISNEEMDQLQSEYELYQISQNSEIGLIEDQAAGRIDIIWQNIAALTWTSSGSRKYPLLCRLSKYILLIPHSNAYCETIFNMVRKVQTELRNQLGKDTKESCSSTSVYSEFTGIRNTLVGILSAKINLFSKVSCYEWKPSDEVVKKAKTITYTTLKQRKEQAVREAKK